MTSTHTGHLAERRADTLSGGEWQRVLVARALAQGADIFVLDEPSVGLDPARLIELFDLLEARRTDGAAVLAVLHDVNLAAVYATRLIGLREGRVCFDAPPHAALTTGTLKELYGLSVTVFPHPLTGAPQMCLAPGTSGFVPCRVAGGDAGLGVSESGGDAG